MESPKVFISYSWNPTENQIWVRELAERLMSDGVHVVLDLWDLQEGQDKNVFMEKMVNDPSVQRVLVVCNKDYAEKANRRVGGVGIESSIISEKVYNDVGQTKFIPIVRDVDENGKAILPTYMASLLYIDLHSSHSFEDGYDKLLRILYKRPLHKRPPLGKTPTYLENDCDSFLPTAGRVHRISEGVLEGKANVNLMIQDYIDVFIGAIEGYKIDEKIISQDNLIQEIEKGIHQLKLLNDDFVKFLQVVVKTEYCTSQFLMEFFERLLQKYEDLGISLYEGQDLLSMSFDNFRYFNHELFISFAATMIKSDKFRELADVIRSKFCVIETLYSQSAKSHSYLDFRAYNYTLNRFKNDREHLNKVSVEANMMINSATVITGEELVKADLLLYYLSLFYPVKGEFFSYWYPELSIYNRSIEVLPRIASKRYFDKVKFLFGVDDVESFKKKVLSIQEPEIRDGYRCIPDIRQGLSLANVSTID